MLRSALAVFAGLVAGSMLAFTIEWTTNPLLMAEVGSPGDPRRLT